MSFNPFWKFLGLDIRHGIFLGLIFGPGFFLGCVGSPRDFFGFLFLPSFDHPHHLKSGVPPPPPPPGSFRLCLHRTWIRIILFQTKPNLTRSVSVYMELFGTDLGVYMNHLEPVQYGSKWIQNWTCCFAGQVLNPFGSTPDRLQNDP